MLDWNPSHHSRHAWEGTKTIWGKIALVLFYALIWFGILTCLVSVIWPGSEGSDCTIGIAKDEDTKTLVTAMIRGVNIVWIGFLGYADVGGLTMKNVVMVTVVIVVWSLALVPIASVTLEAGCIATYAFLWIWPIWVVLALVFTILENKLGDRGTPEENRNLVV